MEAKNKWIQAIKNIGYGVAAALMSAFGMMGYYPLVPAFYASCCLEQKTSILLYVGLFAGMGYWMPIGTSIKYVFILLVIGIAIRFYQWANRRCSGWAAGLMAGMSTVAMNCSGVAFASMERREMVLGVCEGVLVMGLTLFIHYLLQMTGELGRMTLHRGSDRGLPVQQEMMIDDARGRIMAFAEAVDGLSVAFAADASHLAMSGHESVDALEQEITGKLCASCDGCAICWDKQGTLPGKIRQMLRAVVEHRSKEEILRQNYMEECPRYPGMVEEAIWAFSRMELNEAWYKRLRENRLVIAQQLDAMALAMQDWDKSKKNLDSKSRLLLAKIGYELQERGLIATQLHIYEDEEQRQSITALVESKWGGGIPSKNYRMALERATGHAMRLQQDARTILTREPARITAYEDTCFDAISAVAREKKEGASISGDNVSIFRLEEGRHCICLSDGMGSGPAASKESDMVVDLMEKFMEAGFAGDVAIRIMNSAMVLKGENESYSTLDFGVIDLYRGVLELTKIGAAASFLRNRQEVRCLTSVSLPAGADPSNVGEPMRTRLEHGDFLVMVTDGVLEYLHVKNPEEKLAEIISEIKTDNAGVLARTLLERVMLFTGGHAMDDMTIVVTGIWEKS